MCHVFWLKFNSTISTSIRLILFAIHGSKFKCALLQQRWNNKFVFLNVTFTQQLACHEVDLFRLLKRYNLDLTVAIQIGDPEETIEVKGKQKVENEFKAFTIQYHLRLTGIASKRMMHRTKECNNFFYLLSLAFGLHRHYRSLQDNENIYFGSYPNAMVNDGRWLWAENRICHESIRGK